MNARQNTSVNAPQTSGVDLAGSAGSLQSSPRGRITSLAVARFLGVLVIGAWPFVLGGIFLVRAYQNRDYAEASPRQSAALSELERLPTVANDELPDPAQPGMESADASLPASAAENIEDTSIELTPASRDSAENPSTPSEILVDDEPAVQAEMESMESHDIQELVDESPVVEGVDAIPVVAMESTGDNTEKEAEDSTQLPEQPMAENDEREQLAKLENAPVEAGSPEPSAPPSEPEEKLQTFAEIDFVRCPPGRFAMGSPLTETGRSMTEAQHDVEFVRGFWMSVYEVTTTQWDRVMETRLSDPFEPDLPVHSVSWNDCQEFISRLNAQSEHTFRLPTEAEWEYACRANSQQPFSSGFSLAPADANFGNHVKRDPLDRGDGPGMPVAVGSYSANGFGLHDMLGNVQEWCEDYYGRQFYYDSPRVNPKGPSSGTERVVRGGAWDFDAVECRSASRKHFPPGYRSPNLGFRLCIEE